MIRLSNVMKRGISPMIRTRLASTKTTATSNKYPDYATLTRSLELYRSKFSGSLTLAEKILFSHLRDIEGLDEKPKRNVDYLMLRPDRVAMQDASAQMAILQFMLSNKLSTSVPTSIHMDHLIPAKFGAEHDIEAAIETNKEIFEFLERAGKRYGMEVWGPGSGIIHQIVLENYASPGALMLGTDSHTPNAGGLGQLAIGVGGADAVDAMADLPWELKSPQIFGVHLTGKLGGWAGPKDVILYLVSELTVRGGTGAILEYFGDGIDSLACTGMATICNMGAEVGATTSIFPYTSSMQSYLNATNRSDLTNLLSPIQSTLLKPDPEILANPAKYYDKVIHVDLAKIEPMINGPFTPDLGNRVSQFKQVVDKEGWRDVVEVGLIGSCTNSSYHDMSRAASIAKQALDQGIKLPEGTQLLVTPGSDQIHQTLIRDGQADILERLGARVLANACGPCIGQWHRETPDHPNAIVSSFNRNFRARNDGSSTTMNFLASPEIVVAMALSGKLSFNPNVDTLTNNKGEEVKLEFPTGETLPSKGFEKGLPKYRPTPSPQPDPQTDIPISETSTRLQSLTRFPAWNGKELKATVLLKVEGKCTTDHISAAGKWLKYKGHLDNLANNTLIGAKSAGTGKVNVVKNVFSGEEGTIPDTAKDYQRRGKAWAVVTDHNYGEGSAREHAAMQPRHLGCTLILARSFARIHETNLKKQGLLPLTFSNDSDYQYINDGDVIETIGLENIEPGVALRLRVIKKDDGEESVIDVKHTMSEGQIEWFKSGSAINYIAGMSNR